jgi:hypothetical protein
VVSCCPHQSKLCHVCSSGRLAFSMLFWVVNWVVPLSSLLYSAENGNELGIADSKSWKVPLG